jgi:dTDP-glucose 4,6-dehydratase
LHALIVTGAAGFIGSNFVRYILNKYPDYRVIGLDALTYAGNLDNLAEFRNNPRFEFVHGDIRDSQVVDDLAARADAFVNFAAETHVDRSILDPGSFIQTDVAGVHVLLEAVRKHKHSRFLHISTDEVYGTIETGAFKETDPIEPNSPYSASKAGGEMLVRAYHQTYGVPTIVTRGSNTFGPYQYPEKLLPLFISNLIQNRSVPVYGDGLQVRDWIYVEDHCQGVDIALHHGNVGEAYNVGGGNERTNITITRLLLQHLGKGEELIRYVEDRPGHDRRYALDTTKIRTLGYKPALPFEERLAQTVQWYVANEAWWRKILEGSRDYSAFMDTWYKDRGQLAGTAAAPAA